ncbi:hypothetical protein PHSY_004878 [Pseudozyma hubeiensis SY62]|uniref:Uncharacterized protein n=1 Tax=Pseudozyma hubeiensis (strain SY62) TaxID=1305764 RepID=R9P7C9_PSEHS|nr:hypothetical protein PHSY_004878 [Pseudozyma hubeiensis SY62]GAC97293.1 hypothetical protein PHSY_004878 [Pseudozyma hubeiensis SY62]
MSEQDDVASVSASQKSTHATSAMGDIAKDGLSPDHLESLYTDLPADATALKAIVGTMRLELTKKQQSILELKEEIDQVKASHSVVLQRSAEWQDELETLRLRVPQLEEELRTEKQAREAESDRVKDLRIRAEESRRAIMRLQGEQSDARAKAKIDNRRSWVPAATNPPPQRDEQEEAELKKSKRASLIFGPNALNLNTSRPPSSTGHVPGHRRTASGSRSVSGASKGEGEESEEPLSPTFANGLRGLRLSGTAGTNGTFGSLLAPVAPPGADDNGGSAPNSRRSSWLSESGRSPRLAPADLPDSTDVPFTSGSRLSVPAAGPAGHRSAMLSSPALSQGAASSVGVGSPIMEDNEEDESNPSIAATVSKALPNLPSRDSSINFQAHDRELRAKEVQIERLTREMLEMRLTMDEAIEARKASEACLKALRDFIASHDAEADADGRHMADDADRIVQGTSVGAGLLKGVKLPPLPTDNIDDDEEAAHLSPQKTAAGGSAAGGWGMKLPTLMRKATSASSNAPTPSDEARAGLSPEPVGGSAASPSSADGSSATKSIGSSFAGFSNLLNRTATGTTPHSEASQPTTSPLSENVVGSPTAEDGGSGSAFKGFGWFKRTSVLGTGLPASSTAAPQAESLVEEKVLSPPFRSLDHDQLSISRQSVISPPSEQQPRLSTAMTPNLSNGPSSSTSQSSIRTPSASGSNSNALAMAARFGDDDEARRAAESVQSRELGMSDRAQRAASKTEQVEHLTDVLPSFD